MKHAVSIILLLVSATLTFAAGQKDGKYPSKDIEFIVSGGAGGGADAISRKIAQLIEKDLGCSFFVVNKPGADGAVGANLVMGAAADGYHIGIVVYGAAVNAVYSDLIPGYDLNKLVFVANVTEECDAIMVGKDTPYQTFDDLIQAAKANPGKIRIADQGVGSRVNLLVYRIEAKYRVEFQKISYTSSTAQREAILNKEVDAAVTSLGDFTPLLQSGDARGIVEFSTTKNLTFPTVPTAVDLNLGDDFLSSSFLCIVVPAGTPAEIVKILEDSIRRTVTSKEFADWTATVGVSASFMDGQKLGQFVKDTMTRDFTVLDELKKKGILK
jgi:tripartite-type tricarboxylate transporter receptor subunit TctC